MYKQEIMLSQWSTPVFLNVCASASSY